MGNIRNISKIIDELDVDKPKNSDKTIILELKKLLKNEYNDFNFLELNKVVVGQIDQLIKVISENNAIIMPNSRIHDLDSNICKGRLLGAEYIIYLIVRLDSETSTYNLTDLSEHITKLFYENNNWKTINNTVGTAYITDTQFRTDNISKLRLFSCYMTLKIYY